MRKINNFTSVDALGAQYNLYREKTETLEQFQSRLRSCVQNELHRDKYSFERSLDYITRERTKNILRVKVKAGESISFDGVELKIGDSSFFLEDIKFVKDFRDELILKGHPVSELKDYAQYLKMSNVLPFNSDRVRLEFLTPESNLVSFNETQVEETTDFGGLYANQTDGAFDVGFNTWDTEDSLEGFIVDNTSEKTRLLRESKEADSLTYEYKEKYLIIKWSVFSYFDLNSENLDYRIKEKVRVSSTDTEDTPHILTQDGAKLLNKCYKISNTYWGE